MKRAFKNILDAWITTIIGTATMILTLVLLLTKDIGFVWEGIGGLVIGTILLIAPKTVEGLVRRGIDAWGKRGESPTYDSGQPPETLKDE